MPITLRITWSRRLFETNKNHLFSNIEYGF